MRCPHCKGSISAYNFFREQKCPACGEKLKKMPTKEQVKEMLIFFAQDKGYIFWSLVYLMVVWVVAFFEQIFGTGLLGDYVLEYKFRSLLLAAYSGSIIDYIAKANVEVTAVRIKFIFRPPRYLRNFRNLTNFAVVVGFGLAIYAEVRWPNYIAVLPTITLLTSFTVGLVWALMGLALTEDDLNDKRIRYFMEEMRIGRVKYYHRASAIYVGGVFLAGVLYYKLVNISGLWWYIMSARFIYDTVTFFKTYFGWVKTFVD